MDFDVLIIGAGPGGTAAAKKLSRGGKKVALIEQHLVGGECLHYGCIPSKVFLYSAELYEKIQRAAIFGVQASDVKFDFLALLERKKRVVEMLHRGLTTVLEKMGVRIVHGKGTMVDVHTVEIVSGESGSTQKMTAEYIILASGSEPASIPGVNFSKRILNNRTIFDLNVLPKSLLIVGGGVVGCEFASFFSEVGVEVTLVERGERVLSYEDKEISAELMRLLTRRGVKILMNTSLSGIEETADGVRAGDISAEFALIAAGRKLNAQPKIQKSENIFTIGDAAGKALLAYTAEREGEIAAMHILGMNDFPAMDYTKIPNTIFTHPEIASVGAKEHEVSDPLIGKALYSTNSRALIEGDRDGFVKVVAERATKKILGVHIIGKHATLIIDKATLAVENGLTAAEFLKALHGHPVMSEALKEAVENLF